MIFGANGGAGEPCSVNRADIGRGNLPDAFHNVHFAACRPLNGGDVVAESPECGPEALAFGHLDAGLQASILKALQALALHPRGGVNAVCRVARRDVQIAVVSDISIGICRVTGRGGRSVGAVGFELLVAPPVSAGVVGPVVRARRRTRRGPVEFVAPEESFVSGFIFDFVSACGSWRGDAMYGKECGEEEAAQPDSTAQLFCKLHCNSPRRNFVRFPSVLYASNSFVSICVQNPPASCRYEINGYRD